MKPVYVDLHIHTSEDPSSLNENYDVKLLIDKVKKKAKSNDFLISFTDHNVINKKAYLEALQQTSNIILGVELHIRNYAECPPYHCHIFFNVPQITENIIDELNSILDELYKNKVVSKDDEYIPCKEDIIKNFDNYDFMLLPHGGQSHHTFDKSIPRSKDVKFDNTLERNIYYNQFDGFTARSNSGLETTKEYFTRLGIIDFVSLLTCSDNYSPAKYPDSKSDNAEEYIPTWMYAAPNFDGLRMSLSESSRLVYSDSIPQEWAEHITSVYLKNEKLDIDVELTPGLNVVIGGSSSGKTLFVDTLYKKLYSELSASCYGDFQLDDIIVVNPSGVLPHYIHQNYIVTTLSSADKNIGDIDMIRKVFPSDSKINERIRQGLSQLNNDLHDLFDAVEQIDELQDQLIHISHPATLIISNNAKENIFKSLAPDSQNTSKIKISQVDFEEDKKILERVKNFINLNPFLESVDKEIEKILAQLEIAFSISEFETPISKAILRSKKNHDEYLRRENSDAQTKRIEKEKLFSTIGKYIIEIEKFNTVLKRLTTYDISCVTSPLEVGDYTLSIENTFQLNYKVVKDAINNYLKSGCKLKESDKISPEALFKRNYSQRAPKVDGYEDISKKIYAEFVKMDRKNYHITNKLGQDFDNMSPGWKCSVLIDMIMNYNSDYAPLIVDQPEDNLATDYINSGLVKTIKTVKSRKQIILVSHNATIPMLGDAQNVVLCENNNGLIKIRSCPLEGKQNCRSMVDLVAEITDGGKASIKKRAKKYNLKSFREVTK